MKPSTGKVLRGNVVEIQVGMLMTRLKVNVGGDRIITVMVTDEALQKLGARVGDELEVFRETYPASRKDLH